MMSYGWNMMGGFNLIGSLFSIIILMDLILLGMWLWKNIQSK